MKPARKPRTPLRKLSFPSLVRSPDSPGIAAHLLHWIHNGDAQGSIEVVIRNETSDSGGVVGDGEAVEQRFVLHQKDRNLTGEHSWRRDQREGITAVRKEGEKIKKERGMERIVLKGGHENRKEWKMETIEKEDWRANWKEEKYTVRKGRKEKSIE